MLRPTLMVATLALTLTACSSNRESAKKNTVKACMESAQKNGGAAISKDLIKEYCECSADRVIDQSSDEEIKALNDNVMTPEEQQRIMTLAAPCAQTLQQKVMAQQGAAQ